MRHNDMTIRNQAAVGARWIHSSGEIAPAASRPMNPSPTQIASAVS